MRRPDDVVISTATPDDVEQIADIVRRSYSKLPPEQVPADMPIYHASYHAEAMADPHTRWRLLRDADGPAGVVMWRILPGFGHLHLLFIIGESQGEGYGSLMLRTFAEAVRAEDPDARLLTLHCLADATRTIRFYRRHGYIQYNSGDEGRIIDLYLWLDAAEREGLGWPLRNDKLLFYKTLR